MKKMKIQKYDVRMTYVHFVFLADVTAAEEPQTPTLASVGSKFEVLDQKIEIIIEIIHI